MLTVPIHAETGLDAGEGDRSEKAIDAGRTFALDVFEGPEAFLGEWLITVLGSDVVSEFAPSCERRRSCATVWSTVVADELSRA